MEELFASFAGGIIFSVGLYVLVEFIIIVFSKEKGNSKPKSVTYDDKTLKPVDKSHSSYLLDYYSAKAINYRVAKNEVRRNKRIVKEFFHLLDFYIDNGFYEDSQISLETGIYDTSTPYDDSILFTKDNLKFLSLYLALYYGFDTKVEDKEKNGKHYSVLYVSWKDPKVPLIVFNKGED